MPESRLQRTRTAYRETGLSIRFVKSWDIQADTHPRRLDYRYERGQLVERLTVGDRVSEGVVDELP